MESILRWVALALAGILNRFGDPELQAKLDKYNADVAAVEQLAKEAEALARKSEAAYKKSLAERQAWDVLLIESRKNEELLEQQLRDSQERATKIQNDADKAKADLDRLSGGDRVRVDL